MTPLEKIRNEESANLCQIILHPEGLFYRAYERSAFLIFHSVKHFKPTKRHYKIIDSDVVSVGFPKDTYQKYIGGRNAIIERDGTIRVEAGLTVDECAFKGWKDSIPLTVPEDAAHTQNYDRLKVFRESYGLLLHVFEATINIQRDYKCVPGDEIKRSLIGLVRSVLSANDARDEVSRSSHISKALPGVLLNPAVRRLQQVDGNELQSAVQFLKSCSAFIPVTALKFLPAAGYRNYNNGNANNRGSNGNYWSSSPNSGNANNAQNFNFNISQKE